MDPVEEHPEQTTAHLCTLGPISDVYYSTQLAATDTLLPVRYVPSIFHPASARPEKQEITQRMKTSDQHRSANSQENEIKMKINVDMCLLCGTFRAINKNRETNDGFDGNRPDKGDKR